MKLKKFTELLNRSEGESLFFSLALVAYITVTGWLLLVFFFPDDWKMSAPYAPYKFERPNTGFTNPTRYTILATGKAPLGGATLAKRQIKINGNSGYDIWMDGLDVNRNPTNIVFDGTFPDSTFPPTSGSRTYIAYLPPGDTVPFLDEEIFMIMATEQGHYYDGNLALGNNYPNGSYYYSESIPNVTYVGGNLSGNGNKIIYGVYYVKGDVSMNGNVLLQGIVICEGDFNASGNKNSNIYGSEVQYDGLNILRGNGNPVYIQISDAIFSALRVMLPSKSVVSNY